MPADENQRESLKRALENQVRRVSSKIADYDRLDSRISTIRLIVFISGVVLIYLTAKIGILWLFYLTLVAFVASFISLVVYHRKLDRVRNRFRQWEIIRETHLARMSLNWDKLTGGKTVEVDEHHPFAREMNITGKHSLLQLMDTAIYPGGTDKLASWLLETEPDLADVELRQERIAELVPQSFFRDQLQARAMDFKKKTNRDDWDMPTFFRWLQLAKGRSYIKSIVLLFALAVTNIVLVILYLTGVTGGYFLISFLIYLFIYNLNRDKITGLFDDATRLEDLLRRFNNVLSYLETYRYKPGSKLKEFCSIYHDPENRPSRFVKKIIRLSMAGSSQVNEVFKLVLNLLVPWDLLFTHLLNQYKSELLDKMEPWLDRFYELEALCSVANFSWLNPDYHFPEIHPQDHVPVLKAQDLGHPLISRNTKVTNDITIDKTGSLLLITGSNMAGKSTFLRTLGINLCLCFTGAPVNAHKFETIPFRLFSSVNVSDSLDEGMSHFYAEVKRLKLMMGELGKPGRWPLFFLVDEIFRGTNNRERLAGSTALLKYVAGKYGIGVISTHDLELANLEKEIPQLRNLHFEETIEDGRMSFKYKLEKGPCPTTNALKIMEMEGLPVKNNE